MQQQAALGGLQAAVARDPGIEQARCLECSFKAGALRRGHRITKIEQLPKRRALAIDSDIGAARVGCRRRAVDTGLETVALFLEAPAFLGRCAALAIERPAALRPALAGALLRRLEEASGRVVPLHVHD